MQVGTASALECLDFTNNFENLKGNLMNILKTFAATAAIALASFGASASPVSSGGITWDPDYAGFGNDFLASSMYTSTDTNGTTSGYGFISVLNGQSDYCTVSGSCELSFVFSDLANGGTLNFYVNNAGLTASTYGSGGSAANTSVLENNLWLSLAAVNTDNTSDTYSDDFDVYFNAVDVAGTVFSNFDTNTMENGTDVAVIASAIKTGSTSNNTGSATFYGDSIPEPTSIALFGLALMGLAGAARRKA